MSGLYGLFPPHCVVPATGLLRQDYVKRVSFSVREFGLGFEFRGARYRAWDFELSFFSFHPKP